MKEKPKENSAHKPNDLLVGAMLRKRRLSLKLTLAEVEMATKIRGKFLGQIESCDYSAIKNDIYSKGFVQSYADYLGLDSATVAAQYQNERGGAPRLAAKPKKVEKRSRLIITPRLIMALLAIVIAILIGLYLSWQFQGLSAPPRLNLTSPKSDQIVEGALTDIAGSVAGGADVYVNDSPILVDLKGNFHDKLALQNGTNTIRITAKNRSGKSTTITRSIVAKFQQSVASVGQATGTIDGVQMVVSIKGGATALTVEVDGLEKFHGIMLDLTSQVFRGTDTIKLTTSNGGTTSLSITNSLAADKLISPVGREGETKRGLEFSKTTVIQ